MPKFLGFAEDKSAQSHLAPESLPWEKKESEVVQDQALPVSPIEQDFQQLRGVPDAASESTLQKILRNVAGAGQSALSTLIGAPASLTTGLVGLGQKGLQALGISPQLGAPEEFNVERFGVPQEDWRKYVEGWRQAQMKRGLPDPKTVQYGDPPLPTISKAKQAIADIGEKTFDISPEYWDSQTPGESTFRRYVESATAYANPLLGGLSAARALATPLIGLGLRGAAKKMGASEATAEYIGGAGEFASLMINPGSIAKAISEATKKADAAIPKNAVFSGKVLKKTFDKKMNSMQTAKMRGEGTTSEKWLANRVVDFKKDFFGDALNPADAIKFKNGLRKEAIRFADGSAAKLKSLEPQIDFLNKNVDKFLRSYGKSQNPAFLKAFSKSTNLTKDVANIAETVGKVAKTYGIKKAGALGALMFLAPAPLAVIAKGISAVKGIKDLTKIGKVFYNSKAIKNHYYRGLGLASKDKMKEAAVQFQKMEKQLEKDFPGLTEYVKKEVPELAQQKGKVKFLGVAGQ